MGGVWVRQAKREERAIAASATMSQPKLNRLETDTSSIKYNPQLEAVSAGNYLTSATSGMSTKGSVILIRWPVVLISASLILFRSRALPSGALLDAFIVLYAVSNAALYFVD